MSLRLINQGRLQDLQAGTAKVNITPPAGIELCGYVLREQPSLGIHDPLYARALVLEHEAKTIALVSCDLLALRDDSVRAIRTIASQQTGIPPSNIMLSCTHTHSGPATIFLRHCGSVNGGWLIELQSSIAQAVSEAAKQLATASCAIARTPLVLSVDRCGLRGFESPSTDAYLDILKFSSPHKDPLAVLVHYACHPVVLDHTNRYVSADFPGVAMQRIEQEFGAQVMAMFLNGACGNLNPAVSARTWEACEQFGHTLGTTVLELIESAEPFPHAPLRAASHIVELGITLPSVEELQALEREYATRSDELAGSHNRQAAFTLAFLDWARETLHIVETRSHPYYIPMEIQVVGVGDMRIVGIGGELFSQLGEEITGAHSGPAWVCGCTNGNVGYIPPSTLFSTPCYEVADAYKFYGNFMFDPRVPEMVVESASQVMQRVA